MSLLNTCGKGLIPSLPENHELYQTKKQSSIILNTTLVALCIFILCIGIAYLMTIHDPGIRMLLVIGIFLSASTIILGTMAGLSIMSAMFAVQQLNKLKSDIEAAESMGEVSAMVNIFEIIAQEDFQIIKKVLNSACVKKLLKGHPGLASMLEKYTMRSI